MLQPIVAQFTSRGVPAAESEAQLIELGTALGFSAMPVVSFGDLAPQDTLPLHLPELLARSREAVAAGTPVVLMSECTLVPPVLAAVREEHPGVGLIWIDAHGDLNTPATSPSGFLGGMPFAELLGWCFDDWRLQAGLDPPLREERAVLVDGRDLDPGERELFNASRVHEAADAAAAIASLPPGAPLYVHVDTDVLDPSLTPAAGFPAPGGWSIERMRSELATLAATDRVVALSVCPSAPPALDAEGLMPLVDALR